MPYNLTEDLFGLNELKLLNSYKIEFGIFPEDESKEIEVEILNLDDTIEKQTITVGEAMLFIERGTMILPGKYILDKLEIQCKNQLSILYDELIDKILNNNISTDEIISRLTIFAINFENYAKMYFKDFVKSNSTISKILDTQEKKAYINDPKNIAKYIKCKLIKRN